MFGQGTCKERTQFLPSGPQGSRWKQVRRKLAARRSAGRISVDQGSSDARSNKSPGRRLDVQAEKREMIRSEASPLGDFRVPAAIAALAAAIQRPERSFRRFGVLRPGSGRNSRCTMMTLHRRPGRCGTHLCKWPPHAALHSLWWSDGRLCQRPEARDQHDQQRNSGCPAIHVCDRAT